MNTYIILCIAFIAIIIATIIIKKCTKHEFNYEDYEEVVFNRTAKLLDNLDKNTVQSDYSKYGRESVVDQLNKEHAIKRQKELNDLKQEAKNKSFNEVVSAGDNKFDTTSKPTKKIKSQKKNTKEENTKEENTISKPKRKYTKKKKV